MKRSVLLAASVASMVGQFNLPNIRILLAMGFQVHVACNFREGNTCSRRQVQELLQLLRSLHVKCHQWDCPREIRPRKCVKAYRQIKKLIEQHDFAWVHCQSPAGGVFVRLAGHQKKLPVLYTAHGFHFYKGAPLKNWLLYYPAEKLLAHWTDMIITVNHEDYRLAKRRLKAGSACYIPGVGIDTARFKGNAAKHSLREKYRIPKDAVLLLSVGELSKRKNHAAVIRAMAAMPDTNIYYLVCGQGKQYRRLKAMAKKLGVAGRLRLAGYQKQPERFYQEADLFVFPSFQEGLPVALMEAMAAGLACAVSDIRGNRGLIDENGGIRFACRHPVLFGRYLSKRQDAALLDALETLVHDEGRRRACGAYNRQKVKKYGMELVNRKMKRIYAGFDEIAVKMPEMVGKSHALQKEQTIGGIENRCQSKSRKK